MSDRHHTPNPGNAPDEPALTRFADETRSGVVPPSFDDLVAVQQRRRRASALGGAAAVVALLTVGFAGMQAAYDDEATPAPPANPSISVGPSPTTPATGSAVPQVDTRSLTPDQIVNGATSRLVSLTLAPGDPEALTRVSVWRTCADGNGCGRAAYALAVTSDGFATRHLVPVEGSQAPGVSPLDSNSFYLVVYDARGNRRETMLQADGTERDIEFRQSDVRPLAQGEVLIPHGGAERSTYFGLDPATGVAHLIPVPESHRPELIQSPNGLLYGVSDVLGETDPRSVLWSRDGGGTWDSHLISTGPEVVVSPVPSWEPGVMALSEGGLNTVIPMDRLHRTVDGGATWEVNEQPFRDTPYPDWLVVQPGGSLLTGIGNWSNDRVDQRGEHIAGVYESEGANWSVLRLAQDLPESPNPELLSSGLSLAGFAPGIGERGTVWIHEALGRLAFQSGPGIDTWRDISTR